MLTNILTIVVTAYVWNLLTQGGEIFDFVPKIIQHFTLHNKINKMAYSCTKCVAGQIALWYSVFAIQTVSDAFLYVICSIFLGHLFQKFV